MTGSRRSPRRALRLILTALLGLAVALLGIIALALLFMAEDDGAGDDAAPAILRAAAIGLLHA